MSNSYADFRQIEAKIAKGTIVKSVISLLILLAMLTVCRNELYAGIDHVVMDNTGEMLHREIIKASNEHAMHAYNITNATTPGFKPLRVPDDKWIDKQTGGIMKDDVNIDQELAELTKARLRQGALNRFLSVKIAISKRVFTLGKGQ